MLCEGCACYMMCDEERSCDECCEERSVHVM